MYIVYLISIDCTQGTPLTSQKQIIPKHMLDYDIITDEGIAEERWQIKSHSAIAVPDFLIQRKR
jgi:hypothetical protein